MSLFTEQHWESELAEMRAAERSEYDEMQRIYARMVRTARLSECGRYRYSLGRRWGDLMARSVLWVMLNPSTADADIDDNTIRKCIYFTHREGFSRLHVVNLFAFRSTDPAAMLALPEDEARGPENSCEVSFQARDADLIVCAWGVPGGKLIPEALWPYRGKCFHLGLNGDGSPKHPLYLAKTTPLNRLAVV
jgi:hypothetical protein